MFTLSLCSDRVVLVTVGATAFVLCSGNESPMTTFLQACMRQHLKLPHALIVRGTSQIFLKEDNMGLVTRRVELFLYIVFAKDVFTQWTPCGFGHNATS